MTATTDTKSRLIEAARELFLTQGYTATGIAQILKAAKARSGSLYYFFPTKEDLLLAVLETYKDLLWPVVIQPVFDRVSDPIERIFGVLDGYRRMLQYTECSQGCPIGNLALELGESQHTARRLISENFTAWRAAIRQCLDAAADRFPPDVDTDRLALFVLTTMEGAVMLARTYRGIEAYDGVITLLRDYFDRLMNDGAKSGRSKKTHGRAVKKRRN